MNSGAWFLVLMLILWILLLDWEARSFTFHSMYQALRKLFRTKRREEEPIELTSFGDVEAGQGVGRAGDGSENAERRRETMRTNA